MGGELLNVGRRISPRTIWNSVERNQYPNRLQQSGQIHEPETQAFHPSGHVTGRLADPRLHSTRLSDDTREIQSINQRWQE